MKLYSVTDKEFIPYGKTIALDKALTDELLTAADTLPLPESGSAYTASVNKLEAAKACDFFRDEIYGELPVQIGYCCGKNDALNALEWHKSPEINLGVTDLILFLGKLGELENGARFDSANVKAFLLKKGETIEVYADTLHFCPCHTEKDGFGCIVVLPKGTNLPLDRTPADKLLFRKNKWLIAHENNTELIAKGVFPGIYGKNLKVGADL